MREFVPLEELLRPQGVARAVEEAPPADAREPAAEAAAVVESDAVDDALAAARRFRAALDEALDAAVATMLRDVAATVVARELELAPADVAAIVRTVRQAFADEEPIRVRVHPGDVASLCDIELRVEADPRLRRGDVEIDVRDGAIDATLGARLERLLLE